MKYLLLAAVLFLSITSNLKAVENDAQADAILQKLLTAELSKNYDAFVADGTDGFKANVGKSQFGAAADIMIARLAKPYDILPLGEINQHGMSIYLYCIRFKGGGDDILVTLGLHNGKVIDYKTSGNVTK